jgi:hypothetical protein
MEILYKHYYICSECFDLKLNDLIEIDDNDKRFYKISEFINELINFQDKISTHNAKCEYKFDGIDGFDFIQFNIIEKYGVDK